MKKLFILLTISFLLINANAQNYNQIEKVFLQETPDSDDAYLGHSVAVDGNYAVVGAYGHHSNTGIAFVYFYNGSSWDLQAKLTASAGESGDWFGYSVSISGNNIVVGAYQSDGNVNNSGSAYVFTKSGASWSTMTQTAKLTASDGASLDYFGYSVSISGNNIVVGAYKGDGNVNNSGSAYVFTKSGASWSTTTQTAKLTASDGASDDRFGWAVSISGNSIVISAYFDDDDGTDSGSAYVFTKSGASWSTMTQTAKLTASDGASFDYFGKSVSISGDNIVVGAYHDDDNGNSSGSAYVFTKSGASWSTMTQTAKLTASDGASFDYFGYSVSISGNSIVVSAYGDDDSGSNSGSAYVFTKSGASWSTMTQTAKLTASDGAVSDYFGYSVSISGNSIIVGAHFDDDNGTNSGSFYTFKKPISGWLSTTETQKVVGNWNDADFLGYAIAIDGNYSVVGAPGNQEQGAAFVYYFNGNNWVLQAKLNASDGAEGDEFGKSVSIDGGNIVVGAYKNDVSGNMDEGAAYVFVKPGGGWADMTQTAKLTSSVGAAEDYLGRSVSIDGNHIVVGAYYDDLGAANEGSAYVFTKPGTGWVNMTQTAKLTSSVGADDDYFGISVGISGNHIVVGAYKDDFGGNTNEGSAYVFTQSGGNWTDMTETAKLSSSVGAANDNFGISVAIDGDHIVVGAYHDDIGGNTNIGSAYVFTKPGTGWTNMTQTGKLTSSAGATEDYFGRAVSISGNTIAVGAYGDDISSVSTGSAYVFTKPGGGWASMTETEKIIASDGEVDDHFGFSIDVSGAYIAVGARYEGVINSGAAYLYKHCVPLSNTISPTVCDSYTSPSGNYTWTTSGVYKDTLNAIGCDSILTINLTIISISIDSIIGTNTSCGYNDGSATVFPTGTDTLFFEGFEGYTGSSPVYYNGYLAGLSSCYYSNTTGTWGRLRIPGHSSFVRTGNKSITLDRHGGNSSLTSTNYLRQTIDLSAYALDSLTFSFWFINHGGTSHAEDRVWIRGSASDSWVEVFDWEGSSTVGQWTYQELDITNLLTAAGQIVSGSFQYRFGQRDRLNALTTTSNTGLTVDDITITKKEDSYLWNTGDISKTISNLTAGTYYVDVTSGAGCMASDTIVITEANQIYTAQSLSNCDSLNVNSTMYYTSQTITDTIVTSIGCDSIITTNLTIRSIAIDSIIGTNTSCGYNDGSATVSLILTDTLFFEGFESYSGLQTISGNTALAGMPNWEYTQTSSSGRLRIPAGVNYAHSGSNSATLDASVNYNYATNYLIKTIDLSANINVDSLWLSFWWMQHGDEPDLEDRVWVRGSAIDAWLEIFDWKSNSPTTGQWYFKELELMNTLNASSQSLSATFQIRFGQRDNHPSLSLTSTDGLTIDDITLKKQESASYLWNTGDTTKTISNLTAGTYYVDVASGNGCSASDTIVITEANQIYTAQSLSNCDSLNVNGTMYYTSQTITDTIVTSIGCDSIITTNLTINSIAIDSIIGTNVSCYGGNDGGAIVSSPFNLDTLFFEGFEDYSGPQTISVNTALVGIPNWEYTQTNSSGRLRIPAGVNYVHSGSNSVTLDATGNGVFVTNYLIKTIDLSANFNTDSLWLSFWWMQHDDELDLEDRVWVRGSATDAWLEIFDWQSNSPTTGQWYFKELELMNTLNASSQSLSATFQIRFGQRDDYTSTSLTGTDGLTIDDITLTKQASGSYLWSTGDTTKTISNLTADTYYVDVTSGAGCIASDTIVITAPTEINTTQSLSNCDSLNVNGSMYYTSQTIEDTLVASNGCDSIVTTILAINYPSATTDIQIGCDSLTWIDGNTYYADNNTATFTLTSSSGCDSVVTLGLIINNTSIGDTTAVVCDSFTWYGVTHTQSGSPTHTLTNIVGCDSVVTLNLTILESTFSTDQISVCDSYTWIDGNTYTASNNSATYTLANSVGCDSIVTLDLTITTIDNSVTVTDPTIVSNASGATYQWLDCEDLFVPITGANTQTYTASANGEYAVEITQNMCVDTSECVIISTVYKQDNLLDNQITVYPNPTKGLINIDLGSLKDVSVYLYDLNGKLMQFNNHVEQPLIQLIVPYDDGIYILEIHSKDGINIFRIVLN